MAQEIERKFLVQGDYRSAATRSLRITQGYLCTGPDCTVRIRLSGGSAWLTVKGPSDAQGVSRYEWEREVLVAEAQQMLALCRTGLIDKTRHLVPFAGHVFEVDEFEGANRGLVVAEVELSHPDEPFERPPWLGREVTGERRYYNASLARHPYCDWEREP